MAETKQADLTSMVVQLLSAYVSNNTIASEELPGLIKATRLALADDMAPSEPAPTVYIPAVTVRKSLGSRDQIISMIDGKSYKTLKRHLAANGLTPNQYRARYNLPTDYPMVAPGYSAQRREVAQRLGLGRRPKAADTTSPVSLPTTAEPEADALKALRPALPDTTAPIAVARQKAGAKTIGLEIKAAKPETAKAPDASATTSAPTMKRRSTGAVSASSSPAAARAKTTRSVPTIVPAEASQIPTARKTLGISSDARVQDKKRRGK